MRLPDTLDEALAAFRADRVLADAFGTPLLDAIIAVRESELAQLGDASPEHVADASRWTH